MCFFYKGFQNQQNKKTTWNKKNVFVLTTSYSEYIELA